LVLSVAVCAVALAPSYSHAVEAPGSPIETGDGYFSRRAEGHQADWASTEPIKKALAAYIKAYDEGDRSPELAARILKATYFYATYAEKDVNEQKKALQRAIDIGEAVAEKNPGSVALSYQLGGCWGRWGEANGIIASARKGVADRVKTFAEQTVSLDPEYAEGGGFRTLGRLHYKAPYIPLVLSWPDKNESIRQLAMAVKAGPDNLTNHFFYAESLYDRGFYAEALEQVDMVIHAKPDPSKIVEDMRDKKEAGELKEKILARYRR